MVSKVTKKLKLSEVSQKWNDLDQDQKENVKEKVGNYLQKAILQYTRNTNSPVAGEGSFQRLSPDYAKYKRSKGKGSSPNLRLDNDMMDNLEFQTYRDGVEIGIFDNEQAQKADNHNKFSAKSNGTPVPKRQFIPKKDETFKRPIINDIKKIIEKEYGNN